MKPCLGGAGLQVSFPPKLPPLKPNSGIKQGPQKINSKNRNNTKQAAAPLRVFLRSCRRRQKVDSPPFQVLKATRYEKNRQRQLDPRFCASRGWTSDLLLLPQGAADTEANRLLSHAETTTRLLCGGRRGVLAPYRVVARGLPTRWFLRPDGTKAQPQPLLMHSVKASGCRQVSLPGVSKTFKHMVGEDNDYLW